MTDQANTTVADLTVEQLTELLKAAKAKEAANQHATARATKIAKAQIWYEQTLEWEKTAENALTKAKNRTLEAQATLAERRIQYPEVTEEQIADAVKARKANDKAEANAK